VQANPPEVARPQTRRSCHMADEQGVSAGERPTNQRWVGRITSYSLDLDLPPGV